MSIQEKNKIAYLQGLPLEAHRVPYHDFPLGFADLEHDPSQPDYADTQYQLEDNFFAGLSSFA